MASVYEKYYERQPAAVKVIAVGGLALLGYSIYRAVRQNKELKDAQQAATEAAGELDELGNSGIVPSYSSSQFHTWVNALVQAMTGCGTDEQAVFDVFSRMNNRADVLALIVAFGVQYYQPCAWTSPVSYSIWLANDQAYGGDLGTWLSGDFSGSDLAEINSILSERGINFQF